MAMNQKSRALVTLGVLVAATAAAGLYAWFGVHQKQEQEKAAKEQKAKLFDVDDKAKITGLTVQAKGATTTLGRGADGNWEILAPVHTGADSATVDALVDRLLAMRSKAVIEANAADLARFGLEAPTLVVRAKLGDGGKELVLRSGTESGFDSSVYVATGDSKDVIQAEGGFKWALEKDTFDLRDKRLVVFEDAAARGLEVRAGTQRYALARGGEGGGDDKAGWQLTAPLAERADEQTVMKLLGTLRNLRALQVVSESATPDDDKRYGLQSPALEATVALEGGKRLTLIAGKANLNGEKTFARLREGGGGAVVEIATSVFDEMAVKLDELRDKTLVRFDRDAVHSIRFAFGTDDTLVATRGSGSGAAAAPDAGGGSAADTWSFAAPETAKPKQWKLTSLLNALASFKGASIAHENPTDLARFGLDTPSRRIELLDAAGKPVATVALGREEGEHLYARSSTDKRVFAVEKVKLRDWPAAKSELQEPPAAPAQGKDGGR